MLVEHVVIVQSHYHIQPVLRVRRKDTPLSEQLLNAFHQARQIGDVGEDSAGGDGVSLAIIFAHVLGGLFVKESVKRFDPLLVGYADRVARRVSAQKLYAIGYVALKERSVIGPYIEGKGTFPKAKHLHEVLWKALQMPGRSLRSPADEGEALKDNLRINDIAKLS